MLLNATETNDDIKHHLAGMYTDSKKPNEMNGTCPEPVFLLGMLRAKREKGVGSYLILDKTHVKLFSNNLLLILIKHDVISGLVAMVTSKPQHHPKQYHVTVNFLNTGISQGLESHYLQPCCD